MRFAKQIVAFGVVGAATLGLTSCSTEARAERKGKEFGDQVCKVESSGSANEAERHLRRANDKLDDLARFVGRDVREDARDLDRNLDQLARDISRGRNIRQQDVNAIVRSVTDARATTSGSAKAAYDGMLEGLNDCN